MSWNIDGHTNKCPLLLDVLRKVDPSVICVQETMLNSASKPHFESFFRDYHFWSNTTDRSDDYHQLRVVGDRAKGGVSIAWKTDVDFRVSKLNVQFNNMIGILLNTGPSTTAIIVSVYLPTSGQDKEFSEALNNLEQILIQNEGKYDEVYIIGDVNVNCVSSPARTDEFDTWLDRLGMRRCDSESPTHRHKVSKRLTFLDALLTTSPAKLKITTLTEKMLDLTLESDHWPIMLNVPVDLCAEGDVRLEYEEFEGNKWKFQRSQIPAVNKRITEWWRMLEGIPREN